MCSIAGAGTVGTWTRTVQGGQVEVTGSCRSRTDGRHIFISDGMASLAENDDQLAFVLAHEMAHVACGHAAQRVMAGTWNVLARVFVGFADIDQDGAGLMHGRSAEMAGPQPFSKNQIQAPLQQRRRRPTPI